MRIYEAIKPTVYVETSVVSYLSSRLSSDVTQVATYVAQSARLC